MMNFLERSCLQSGNGVNVTVNYSLHRVFFHIYKEETMRFISAFTCKVEACHSVDHFPFKQNTITVKFLFFL